MTRVNEQIKSIVVIPGGGEFIYDTEVVLGPDGTPTNSHQGNGKSDAQNTIDGLTTTFPNLKNVSLVIGWFANSKDAGKLTISPRVESKQSFKGDQWKVGNYTRQTTILTKDWGGTPSDKSVIDLVKTLTDKGINVTIYPMLFVDDKDKSWRGDIKANSKADIDHFYEQYNKFIMHYAKLESNGVKLQDMMKNIIIGSEMVELLRYDDGSKKFYGVEKMASLATEVKQAVGQDIKTIYAANWDEYGRDPKTGYYNMDKLYEKIDKVGIDAYFKLTDNMSQDKITPEIIKKGWESGIDYDYYIDDNGKKGKLDDPSYAIKNVKWWYGNEHINPDGTKTSWVPGGKEGAKEVIATEMGFTSTDGTTNDPSKFYSPGTSTSGFPEGSSGKADANAQIMAIQATIDYWDNVHTKDTSNQYTKLFAEIDWYSYDIRGDFSKLPGQFDDAGDYGYGHWLKVDPTTHS